jgi:hypothetical protein
MRWQEHSRPSHNENDDIIRHMKSTIPAAIILAAVTTEAILDHEHAKPHVDAPAVGQIVSTPVPGPVPATGFDLRQIEEPRP